MRKIVAMLLALAMMLTLVSCGQNAAGNDADSDSKTEQTSTKDDTQETKDPTTDTTPGSETQPDTPSKDGEATTPANGSSTDATKPSGGTTTTTKPTTGNTGSSGNTGSTGNTGNSGGTTTHTHSYTAKVVPATTTAGGYTLHTCSCGDSYKDNYTPKLSSGNTGNTGNTGNSGSSGNTGNSGGTTTHTHSYTAKVVPATCKEKGYTLYTCSCGDNYKANYTAVTSHNWVPVYETLPVYETVCITRCSICDAELSAGNYDSHIKGHMLAGEGGGSYETTKQVQVGTEDQLVGYRCSVCGTEK